MILNHYEVGDPDHPPVVILHGLFGSGENWRSVAGLLQDAFRVVALDQRNHGASDHAPQMTYSHMAADVSQTMDELEISSAAILGHSMGGKTAMYLALNRPELVERLIVVDIAPRAYPPGHEHILEGLSSLQPSELESRKEAIRKLEPFIPDARVRRFLVKNLTPEDSGYRWQIGLDHIRANYPAITGGIDSFDMFEKPVLFIRGDKSAYVSDTDIETVRAYFPEAEFVTLEGGHWIHADDVHRFVEAVRGFLSQSIPA